MIFKEFLEFSKDILGLLRIFMGFFLLSIFE
jgi:hypothetical protein